MESKAGMLIKPGWWDGVVGASGGERGTTVRKGRGSFCVDSYWLLLYLGRCSLSNSLFCK